MRYKVSRQYARGGESQFAQFSELSEARLFIHEK